MKKQKYEYTKYLVSPDTLAKQIGITVTKIIYLIKTKRIESIKIDKKIFIDTKNLDIEELKKDHRRKENKYGN